MSRLNASLLILLITSTALYGCGSELAEEAEPAQELASSVDALEATLEYNWSQGQSAVKMKPSTGWVCFLTKISGKFRSTNERVEVVARNGYWYLRGGSGQSGVSAEARCAETNAPLYGPYTAIAGHAWTEMGPAADRVCFLSMVTGSFLGSGERVSIMQTFVPTEAGPVLSWILEGATNHTGVAASAYCVGLSSYDGQFDWKQGEAPATMSSTTNKSCALTRMTGSFGGAGESIRVILNNSVWELGGASQQTGVSAGAFCF